MYKYVLKPFFDFVFALIAIILLALPMLIVAIAIKCESKGPVIFKQERVGKNGKVYWMYKFRSMCVGAEQMEGGVYCTSGDKRVTKVGKFIRKTSLDELPQLFNILKGDMTIVGPRPERPQIIAQYMEEMPEFALRMKVKAGLAGYAQVYGKYNTTPKDKLMMDMMYIENYSVFKDVQLFHISGISFALSSTVKNLCFSFLTTGNI